jgi:hypothetical protein
MASTEEQVLIASDAEVPARDARQQGFSKKVKVMAACSMFAAAGAITWHFAGGKASLTQTSASGSGHFLADKHEEMHDPEVARMLDQASDELQKITDMRDQSEADMETAEKEEKKATADEEAANKTIQDAEDKMAKADGDAAKADKEEQDALDTIQKANQTIAEATQTKTSAAQQIEDAKKEAADAKKIMSQADELEAKAQEENDKVAAVEEEAMAATAAERVCVPVPGAQLAPGKGENEEAPIAAKKNITSAEACSTWCQSHEGCAQSIFCKWDKSCKMYEKANPGVIKFEDGFGSAYCGDTADKKALEKMVEEVMSHKPEIPDVVDCAWDGEDCSGSSCCNSEVCSWDFSECKPSTCFKGSEGATCMAECYDPSNCENVGTGREQRELPAAKEGVLVQGSSLYCFMVVAWKKEDGRDEWSESEAAIANNIKDKKAGIYECDDSDVFEGDLTAVTDWKTYLNADLFIGIWNKVKESGKYAGHDWIVKVDADAVFFPAILKQHIAKLRTPQGARVYLRNSGEKFQFNGALEVFTRQAVDLFFEKGWACEAQDHGELGEDYYVKHCMDSIGVDHQVDKELIKDRSGDTSGGKQDCSDGWTAAFHWQRSVNDWNKCHDAAAAAQDKARELWLAEHKE